MTPFQVEELLVTVLPYEAAVCRRGFPMTGAIPDRCAAPSGKRKVCDDLPQTCMVPSLCLPGTIGPKTPNCPRRPPAKKKAPAKKAPARKKRASAAIDDLHALQAQLQARMSSPRGSVLAAPVIVVQ
jgi:hypothetical protein